MGAVEAVAPAEGPSDHVLRQAEAGRQLDEAVRFVTQMAKDDRITVRQYNRHLVTLAWGYVEAQQPARGLGLVSCLAPEYLGTQLPEDGADDRELARAADGLATWLSARGHVDAEAGDGPDLLGLGVGVA